MPWKIVENKIGRAGDVKKRTARQREWDRKYGEGHRSNSRQGWIIP
jgi:hypothetical protein